MEDMEREMTQEELNAMGDAINNLVKKSYIAIKSKRLKLTKAQVNVLKKIMDNKIHLVLEQKSVEVLEKKGLVRLKPESSWNFRESMYEVIYE
jgi:hypothetical protein